MKYIFFFLISIHSSFANTIVDPVMEFKSMEHENPGCPINSECSKHSGIKILKWEKFINKTSGKNKTAKLNQYLNTNGIPLYFLTHRDSKIALDPIMWNSRCKHHNPKNPNNNIFKALKFFKEIPPSKHAIFTPVIVYEGTKEIKYNIPYQDQIVLLDGNEILTLKDYDDFYYQLKISPKGNLKVSNISSKLINKALDRKVTETKCPTKMKIDDTYFLNSYCQKILDIKSNKLKIIQYGWACR